MQWIKPGTRINFLGKKKVAAVISAAMIIAGVVSLIAKGGPRYGVDFTGGTLVQLKFSAPVEIKDVRAGLKEMGLGDSDIQRFGVENEIIVRMGASTGELQDFGEKIAAQLREKLPGQTIEVRRTELVGPKAGKDLRQKGILAIVVGWAAMLIYITWRFEFKFAVGAIVALVHDVTITIGVFSLLDKEITLTIIAALLSIIGYSVNDTIVVFDRVRENIKARRKGTLAEVLNLSINETLSRTLLTSFTVLIAVVVLTIFGGGVIRDFAFALVIGVIVGTYSSIYIAGALVSVWQPTKSVRKLAAARRR